MLNNLTQETLEAMKAAQAHNLGPEGLAKSWMQNSGLANYDLEKPAKRLVPVLTPLRNKIPRVKGNGDLSTRWRAITGININKMCMGVSEGRRSGVIASSTAEYSAPYAGLGLEDEVTFEAEYAGQGFQDVKATAVLGALQSFMIGEEQLLLGGNRSLALGVTPTPTLTVGGNGSIPDQIVSVICVALTNEGYYRATLSGGIEASVTRTNADGTQDTFGGGAAQKSAPATVDTNADDSSITAVVTPVRGAVAYAWYAGASGSERLAAITTTNVVTIKSLPTAPAQLASDLPAADNSRNELVFDGLLTYCFRTDGNAYYRALTDSDGKAKPLSVNSPADGGIEEIDEALRHFWDNHRLSPTEIWVSSQELVNLTHKVVNAGGAPFFRFNLDANSKDVASRTLTAGMVIGQYLNKFGGLIPFRLHPNMPPGTIYFHSDSIPYPGSNIGNTVQVKTRKEYYQIEWPLRTRRYEFGVYSDQLLQHYAPFACGVITNIANG